MAHRDRRERVGKKGARAAQRSRVPDFLLDDDMDAEDESDDDLGVSRMKRRTRRVYDERRDADDMDGIEDVSSFFFLPDLSFLTLITGITCRATE